MDRDLNNYGDIMNNFLNLFEKEKDKNNGLLDLFRKKSVVKLIQFFINHRGKRFMKSNIKKHMTEETAIGANTVYNHFGTLKKLGIVKKHHYKYKRDSKPNGLGKGSKCYWELNDDNELVQAILKIEKIMEEKNE